MSTIHRPLVLLLVSFSSGIALWPLLRPAPQVLGASAGLLIFVLFCRTVRGCGSLWLPAGTFVILGMLGSAGIPNADQPPPGIRRLLLEQDYCTVVGTVAEPPEYAPERTRVRLRLESFNRGERWHAVSGGLLLTIRNCRRKWPVGRRLIGRIRVRPVRNFNNPGAFNYRQHLANQGIWARTYVPGDDYLLPLAEPAPGLGNRLLHSIRTGSRAFLDSWLPGDLAALYRALLLGERSALEAPLRDLLYNAGIGHLLAISGLHIGMVAGSAFLVFYFLLLRSSRWARRWGARPGAALLAFPFAFCYALLSGMQLPALRATLMLAAFTLALICQRTRALLNSLLLAAFIILVLYPEALFSASFQLSFIAVGALVFVVPRLPFPRAGDGHQRGWPRRLRLLCQFIAVSLVLSLFTAPAVLYHFHRVSPVGTVANIVVVPLVSFLILPAGLAALCILPVSTNLAGFLLTLGSLGLDLVVKVATWLGGLSWACLWPGIPRAWEVALAYVLLLLPFLRVSSWWRGGLILAGSLLLVVSWTLPAGFGSKQSFLRVTYLDVGQGNSAVVEFPQKAVMLIDGGGFQGSSFDVGRHLVAPYLWHRRIRSLDVMALSHAHADHFLGLRFVAAHFPVKEFWYNKVSTDDPHFLELIDCLARKNVAFLGPEHLASGRRIQGVDVKVLHPPAGSGPVAAVPTHTELNNLSLVLWLRYKHIGFLFPGDIEREAERRLTSLPGLKPVQVLLVPHHGSRTSSSMAFLQRLKPKIAVFSLGFANPFHLPASRVRKRYRNLGVRTCRTDRHGAITIRTDGHDIQVETFLPAKQ